MANFCLGCREQVNEKFDSINDNYEGLRIHYGTDWYCGPVVLVSDENSESVKKFLAEEKTRIRHLEEFEINHYNKIDPQP